MARVRRGVVLLTLVGALWAGACYDLTLTNPNAPDFSRALGTPEAALGAVGEAFHLWFLGNYGYRGAGLALSNASFQHTEPWAHSGSEAYARIPRIAFINSAKNGDYTGMIVPWSSSYQALRSVVDGLRALEDPEVAAGLTTEQLGAARAFGKFVQGVALASVAVYFAEGFVVDEVTDPEVRQEPQPYGALMVQALAYLDECARLSAGASWTLPEGWMKAALTGPELARAARSMKARYRAAAARTPAERAALDWNAIVADVDGGITGDLILDMDDNEGWGNEVLGYGTYSGWSQLGFFIYGMADQSGNFQRWNAAGLRWEWGQLNTYKDVYLDGRPMLIVTPDLRFPRGSTLEAQRLAPGRYFRVNREGGETGHTWARPDRGTWRWSWYKHTRGEEYWGEQVFRQPEIRISEMRLLKAEALYRMGNRGAAAAIVNETRVPAGLDATDAAGTNISCVPRLPDGTCGDLFEMLKWEKRMENTFKGPMGNLWYFDGRGWGDLWRGTFLHLPVPCTDATVLDLDCTTFGGAGEGAAATSVYRWHEEG